MPALSSPPPSPVLPAWLAAVAAREAASALGHEVVYAPVMPSTHAHALTLADAETPHGTLVTTDHQVDGRGRHGRPWLDAPGAALLVSLVLRPAPPPEAAPRVTLALAVALADVLRNAGLAARLKWPNDVRIAGRKVAGLLATRTRSALVMSFGLNVNQTVFPADLAPIATSMAREAGRTFARGEVLADVLTAFEPLLQLAPTSLLERYRARLEGIGETVEIRSHEGAPPRTGVFEDVTPEGGLRLRSADGRMETFYAGDVSLRTPGA